nr:sugar ABC transporter permease [Marinicella sp. W31]MDC2878448.1 sugar ABC transporter permease [Marinicella sp. W31]
MPRKLTPYLFVLPLISFIAVFTYIPIVTSIDLSFRQWDFMTPDKPFVGFENYRVLFNSREFWNSLRVTAIFAVVSVPLRLALALLIASALTRETFSRRILRGALFLPSVTSTVSIAVVFSWVFPPITAWRTVCCRFSVSRKSAGCNGRIWRSVSLFSSIPGNSSAMTSSSISPVYRLFRRNSTMPLQSMAASAGTSSAASPFRW